MGVAVSSNNACVRCLKPRISRSRALGPPSVDEPAPLRRAWWASSRTIRSPRRRRLEEVRLASAAAHQVAGDDDDGFMVP